MKIIFCVLLLSVALCGPLRLNLDNSILISPGQKMNLPLTCTGSSGQVNFQAKGLPKGLFLSNGAIQGVNEANSGYYPVIIDARDEKNNFISQILVIKIANGSGNSQIIVNGGQNANLVTSVSSGASSSGVSTINVNINGAQSTQNVQQANQNQNYQVFGGLVRTMTGGQAGQGVQVSIDNAGGQSTPSLPSTLAPAGSGAPSAPAASAGNGQPANGAQPSAPSQPRPIINQPSIDNLLSQFAPLDMGASPAASPSAGKKSYPVPDLPTGASSNALPNTTPMFIDAAQAPRLPSDKNKITADSVKATAIFERQLNANKAIANLLDIIEQLTANANAAKADIPVLDGQVKTAVAAQRTVQSKIITAENQRSRLNTAINNLNDNINILRKQLADLQTAFKDSTESVATKKTQLGTLLATINKYEDSLKDINAKITKQKDSIALLESQIKDTQNEIQANRQLLDKKTKEAANIDVQIDVAVKNIKGVDDQIADLKDKLNKAQIRKAQAEDEEKRLRLIKTNAPVITAELEGKILKGTQNLDRLNEQKLSSSNDLGTMNANLDDINLNMGRFKSQFNQVQTEIKLITGNRKDYDDAIAAKNKEIIDAVANLQFLKGQVESYDSALRNAYNDGNDANARVNNAKQNLDALVKRWERDSKSLSDATLNLEKARAEKELSDLAMQELLRERSSALPYSVVPNGNSMTNAGTPTGNNPRGSPLGPIQVNNIENSNNPFPENANRIDSFNNYLSSAYGQGVDPAVPSSVTRNYPFTIYRSNSNPQLRSGGAAYINAEGQQVAGITMDGNGVLAYNGDFSCGSAPSDMIDGVIKAIGNNVFNVQTNNGTMYVVKVGSCSQAIANSPNYAMAVGDKIKLAGQAAGTNVMNLYQATCDCSKCNQAQN